MAAMSPFALISSISARNAVVLPHCRGAWTTKYCSFLMSDQTSGSLSEAGSM